MCSLISDERLQLLTQLCTSFLPLRHIRGTIQQGEAQRHSLVWVAHPWPMVFWKHILNDNPKLKKRNKWGDWLSWLFEFKDQGIARKLSKTLPRCPTFSYEPQIPFRQLPKLSSILLHYLYYLRHLLRVALVRIPFFELVHQLLLNCQCPKEPIIHEIIADELFSLC